MDKAQRDYLQNVVRHDTFLPHSQVNMSDLGKHILKILKKS